MAMTTTVNDIEHIESQSLPGSGVIKVFFQPHTSVDAAVAQSRNARDYASWRQI